MLEELFRYRGVYERHRCAPFLDERERYLCHKATQGCTHETLISIASELRCVGLSFAAEGSLLRKVTSKEIEQHAREWARKQRSNGRAKGTSWSHRRFAEVATEWFRFLQLLPDTSAQSIWFSGYIEQFARFMESELGLSPRTIAGRCWHLKEFLQEQAAQPLCSIQVSDIDQFLKGLASRGWCRVSLAKSASALRAFFRYAARRMWCGPAIGESIQSPRLFAEETMPIGPSWDAVNAFIESTNTRDPLDIRDRAILLLLSVYGLRSAEVRNLCLDQIDWDHDLITIRRCKQRRTEVYPLVVSVGNAVLTYVRIVRPKTAHREVFLTIKAPIQPLSGGALYHAVSKRLKKLGIRSVRRGPHALRHSCATHLLAEGFSLKAIGDHLGHASATATHLYAKVDVSHLREVITFCFGGEL